MEKTIRIIEKLTAVNDSSYKKYEDLLLKRDELRKEVFQFERAYIREFGDLILRIDII